MGRMGSWKQQKEFADQLKKVRETLQDEYNNKIKQTVDEIDEFKAELERSGLNKQEKTEKLYNK